MKTGRVRVVQNLHNAKGGIVFFIRGRKFFKIQKKNRKLRNSVLVF